MEKSKKALIISATIGLGIMGAVLLKKRRKNSPKITKEKVKVKADRISRQVERLREKMARKKNNFVKNFVE